jgi:hypothetical protein
VHRFADPLGASAEDVAPSFAEPQAAYVEPLSAVLVPLPVYDERPAEPYRDALAVPPPADDPLALPLLASTDGIAADLTPVVTDQPTPLPSATPVEPPTPEPVEATAEPDDPLDPPTLRTAVVPELLAEQPVEGGRITVGMPRGWSPPTVPDRRWSAEVPPPAPEPTRRRGRAGGRQAPPPQAVLGLPPEVELPPGMADALANIAERRAGRRRAKPSRSGRITLLVVLAVLIAQMVGARYWTATVVLGVVALLVALSMLRPSGQPAGRRARPDGFLRPPAG